MKGGRGKACACTLHAKQGTGRGGGEEGRPGERGGDGTRLFHRCERERGTSMSEVQV